MFAQAKKLFGKPDATIDDFFANMDDYPKPMQMYLKNMQTYDLVGTRNPSKDHLQPIVNELQAKFKVVLIAELFKESMIVIRRELCLDRKDMVYLEALAPKGMVGPRPKQSTAHKIRTYSAGDQFIYLFFKTKFERSLRRELYWEEEMEELSIWNQRAGKRCAALAKVPEQQHLSWAMNHIKQIKKVDDWADRGGQAPDKEDEHAEVVDDRKCRMMLLGAKSYRTLVRDQDPQLKAIRGKQF